MITQLSEGCNRSSANDSLNSLEKSGLPWPILPAPGHLDIRKGNFVWYIAVPLFGFLLVMSLYFLWEQNNKEKNHNPAHNAANAVRLREQLARQEFASHAGWRTSAAHGDELVHHAYNRHPSLATNSNGLVSPQLYHQRAIGNITNPASEIHRLGGTRYAAFNPQTGEFTVFSWEGGGGLAAGSPTIHSYYIPLRNQMATGIPFQSQGIVNLADIRP